MKEFKKVLLGLIISWIKNDLDDDDNNNNNNNKIEIINII